MYNPLDTIRKFQSRMGKPIRPIIELQKNARLINIITNTVQEGNMINDAFRAEAWEVHPEDEASAIYIDGIFKGMGYVAGDEGCIIQVRKEIEAYEDLKDENGKLIIKDDKPVRRRIVTFAYKGIFGKWLDAGIIERGSALKPNMTQTLIYCFLVGLVGFLIGMVWR